MERRHRREAETPPIVLAKLTAFICTGDRSPCFWKVSEQDVVLPEVRMPRLAVADLSELPELEAEVPLAADVDSLYTFEDDDDEMIWDALQSLCYSSPRIVSLNLSHTSITDLCLPYALRHLGDLRTLCLRGCDRINDGVIRTLADVAPTIQDLDVRDCFGVSCIAVAALAESLVAKGGGLRRVYADDPGPLSFYNEDDNKADYWGAQTYDWLVWVGIAVEWEEASRPRGESKKRWGWTATPPPSTMTTPVAGQSLRLHLPPMLRTLPAVGSSKWSG
jgi:hypothetical protein